jgi:hypothetical protein
MLSKSSSKKSNINFTFGDKVQNDSPINIQMTIDFCSQKVKRLSNIARKCKI